VLPARNEPDLHEVPPEVRQELAFIYATRVEDVLAAALGCPRPPGGVRLAGAKRAQVKWFGQTHAAQRCPCANKK